MCLTRCGCIYIIYIIVHGFVFFMRYFPVILPIKVIPTKFNCHSIAYQQRISSVYFICFSHPHEITINFFLLFQKRTEICSLCQLAKDYFIFRRHSTLLGIYNHEYNASSFHWRCCIIPGWLLFRGWVSE